MVSELPALQHPMDSSTLRLLSWILLAGHRATDTSPLTAVELLGREKERLPGYNSSHFSEMLSAKILEGKEMEGQNGTGQMRQDRTDGTGSHTLDSSSASLQPATMGWCHTGSDDLGTGNS